MKYIYYFKNGIHIKYNRPASTAEIDKLETTMGELIQEEYEVEYPDMIKVQFIDGKTKVSPFEKYKKYRLNPETEMIMNYATGEVLYYKR